GRARHPTRVPVGGHRPLGDLRQREPAPGEPPLARAPRTAATGDEARSWRARGDRPALDGRDTRTALGRRLHPPGAAGLRPGERRGHRARAAGACRAGGRRSVGLRAARPARRGHGAAHRDRALTRAANRAPTHASSPLTTRLISTAAMLSRATGSVHPAACVKRDAFTYANIAYI